MSRWLPNPNFMGIPLRDVVCKPQRRRVQGQFPRAFAALPPHESEAQFIS